jgi:uncharacterized membrane protein
MEDTVHDIIDWVVPLVEVAGAALIVGGVVHAVVRVLWLPFMRHRPPLAALDVRLGLGLALALGIEFQLAGDILRTAVSPTYRQIAMLASIAAIRTGLNFFLGRELLEGRRQLEALSDPGLHHQIMETPSLRRSTPDTPDGPTQPLGGRLRAAFWGPFAPGSPLRQPPEPRQPTSTPAQSEGSS